MTADRGATYPGAGDKGEAFPGYRGSLNASCVTIAQVLKPAGYRTAAVGKWHVGDSEPPTARGFDDFYRELQAGADFDAVAREHSDWGPGQHRPGVLQAK